uniref:Alpha-L-arabinofuranosidase B catalytic domain-containing protein n=1 Tax=Phaeocystis antarctica TaxID=33657 RepID=A0A7S0HDZ0_9EUKA
MFFAPLSLGFAAPTGPLAASGLCDIAAAAGNPCVAAHSTVRAMYSSYSGALYQVQRSDNSTMDVKVLTQGGYVDAKAQDTFCGASACVISSIYDQSPMGNHLAIAPPGGAHEKRDAPVNATADPLTIGGHRAYSAYFEGGMGYRRDRTSGIAKGDEAETVYMVTAGQHYNDRCCFDYGNAETNDLDDGAGTMEAVYFGNANGGLNHGGAGKGPWIMADMENALWGADKVQSNEPSIQHEFVTAMIKGDAGEAPGHWAIKGGDAQAGGLTVLWDGPRAPHYAPMKKQGAIILGIGGDNSDGAVGTFYEGAMLRGYTTDGTDDAMQANIVAAGYGK